MSGHCPHFFFFFLKWCMNMLCQGGKCIVFRLYLEQIRIHYQWKYFSDDSEKNAAYSRIACVSRAVYTIYGSLDKEQTFSLVVKKKKKSGLPRFARTDYSPQNVPRMVTQAHTGILTFLSFCHRPCEAIQRTQMTKGGVGQCRLPAYTRNSYNGPRVFLFFCVFVWLSFGL